MSKPKHTAGPWRWEINLKSKRIELCGGRPQFDLCVLSFKRWGMNSAKVEFLQREGRSGPLLIEPCEKFATPIKGREHHAAWLQTINHPDAQLIESAPDHALMLSAITSGIARWEKWDDEDGGIVCIGALGIATRLDEFGCPVMNDSIRSAIIKARDAEHQQ